MLLPLAGATGAGATGAGATGAGATAGSGATGAGATAGSGATGAAGSVDGVTAFLNVFRGAAMGLASSTCV